MVSDSETKRFYHDEAGTVFILAHSHIEHTPSYVCEVAQDTHFQCEKPPGLTSSTSVLMKSTSILIPRRLHRHGTRDARSVLLATLGQDFPHPSKYLECRSHIRAYLTHILWPIIRGGQLKSE